MELSGGDSVHSGHSARYDGLEIAPCIPADWPGFTVLRRFRNATYRIVVENPAGVNQGVVLMTVDGERVAGNLRRSLVTEKPTKFAS